MPSFDALVDDFEDGSLDTGLWSGSYGDPAETGGQALIPCTTGYAGLKSASAYTLTGSGITVRVHAPVPDGATSSAASVLVLTGTGGTDAGFIVDSAQTALGLYSRTGYADGDAVFLTYSPGDHAWLRFREDSGSLYWDASPDGLTWTNLRTAATPAWAADTDLAFLVEGHRDAGTPDTIALDSVNVLPVTVVTGAASLTASATLAAAGRPNVRAAAALAGSTQFAAHGVATVRATAALTAAVSAACAGRAVSRSAATLSASATLAAAGRVSSPIARGRARAGTSRRPTASGGLPRTPSARPGLTTGDAA
ncbi:hypothetical protein [Streptomyces sp. Amel2xC10]|uniref:hypothetical protein n=1 Tax=Streptomyces sp. Amel2xC10 TaxID=1305826 RepID=UPI000A08D1EB|nr:hypothetical protein [Streptomyces sp. Amel2xC10]SMF86116.1 hypothetical protein SAMN02745830_07125 [Streptomyces sp. Amel2xC10]